MKSEGADLTVGSARSDWNLLFRCGMIALVVEGVALMLAGTSQHWMVHPSKTVGLDESRFVEAQVVTVPKQTHLVSESSAPTAVHHEAVINKEVGKGRQAKPNESRMEETNDTKSQGDKPLPPSHGPVAFYTPSPVIPPYLQTQEINASVVIEFLVSLRGVVTPRLLSSSGNEELDAIALNTARQWQFRPAEDNHVAIDAKVRLRIVFEVK